MENDSKYSTIGLHRHKITIIRLAFVGYIWWNLFLNESLLESFPQNIHYFGPEGVKVAPKLKLSGKQDPFVNWNMVQEGFIKMLSLFVGF